MLMSDKYIWNKRLLHNDSAFLHISTMSWEGGEQSELNIRNTYYGLKPEQLSAQTCMENDYSKTAYFDLILGIFGTSIYEKPTVSNMIQFGRQGYTCEEETTMLGEPAIRFSRNIVHPQTKENIHLDYFWTGNPKSSGSCNI